MDDPAGHEDDGAMSVQLDVHLDRQPVTGRLRTAHGADERFVGWLGFVEVLKMLADPSTRPTPTQSEEQR